jgi:hypothetical protein
MKGRGDHGESELNGDMWKWTGHGGRFGSTAEVRCCRGDGESSRVKGDEIEELVR